MRHAWGWLVVTIMSLSGCAGYRTADPLAFEGSRTLSASCQQSHAGPLIRQVAAAAEALEKMGYQVRSTDAGLGLVSAERRTSMPGLGAVDEPFISGWGGHYRRGFGFGAGFGGFHSPWGVFRGDPVRVEQVSVAPLSVPESHASDTTLAVTREVSVVMPDGYVRYRALELPDEFCQQLHQSIDQLLHAGSGVMEPTS
ncbi:hypothetical protein [Kushneria phosphatilytica]|uniref:Uncharacterized protein n=1 Tax=Kushneria phosphatilytica TaxID=657387 RepID=A0A1S1NLM2_9GAMM|nr:hypothetical protein [Kushneria phosphatilytica]OHV07641.1 hypothetical protein BH688_15680 [Kushneria phosphatilytica]QEL10131.1 hypothetical protein FY550_02615 [Kushneria phosphatilytica]